MVAAIVYMAVITSFLCCDSPKNKLVKLSLESKKYDNLFLKATTKDSEERLAIRGTSENGYDWAFVIPDSIFERVRYYEIRLKIDI